MGPIQQSIESGDYSRFEKVCSDSVSVNMENPLNLRGNYGRERFVKIISEKMNEFKVTSLEWISKHIWENYAVQSLNLELKNIRSGKNEFYKLIFFMKRNRKKWTLYYLRGIKL